MPNGYSVANGMKEAIHYLQHGELHTDEVSGIFICSDGLFHPLVIRTNCCIYKKE